MRIVVLTLEALAAAESVRRFVFDNRAQIAAVGLSNPHRGPRGGMLRQTWRYLVRCGPRFLPYLVANFELPRWSRALSAIARKGPPERTPLDMLCRNLGIPLIEIGDVNGAQAQRALAGTGADLAVSFHFDKILAAETIALFPMGVINVHVALLPSHRGPVPTLHALLEDEPRFGLTIHRVVPQIDAGPILAQSAETLPLGTSALGAARELHRRAVPHLERVIADIEAGRARERMVPILPYCGFPTRKEMRALKRRGRAAACWRDFSAALRTPV